MKRYFELKKEKFWTILVEECCVTINYGKVNTVGKQTINCYESAEKATKLATKFIQNKLMKGYVQCEYKDNKGLSNQKEFEDNNSTTKRLFPKILTKLHSIEIDYADGKGIDFEPFEDFYSLEETTEWIQNYMGNTNIDGAEYLIFGQDGTGGYVAIWCIHNLKDLLEQPIVFFGSEGEIGVIAKNMCEYVWLFAGGFGPYEAVEYPNEQRKVLPKFLEFAETNFGLCRYSPKEIINRAKKEYPDFEKHIDELCR